MEQDRKKLTLEEARKVINEQDAIILEAFEKRMAAAKEVVRNKIEAGTPIYVPAREQEILDRIASQAPEELSEYAVQLYQKLMEVSSVSEWTAEVRSPGAETGAQFFSGDSSSAGCVYGTL